MADDAKTDNKSMTPAQIMAYLGVPVTQRNQPDLLNHRPNKLVSLEEAKTRGWSWFYSGATPCRYGHIAARRTSNPAICSDCDRVGDGQEPIYPQLDKPRFKKPPNKPELVEAAVAVAKTPATSTPAAVPSGAPTFFEWTPARHQQVIDVYINTGLLEDARAAVGCTRAQLLQEMKDNRDFAARVKAAQEDAEGVIEEALIKAARAGQTAVLPKAFEIIERRALQRNPTGTQSPEQIEAEFKRVLAHSEREFTETTFHNTRTNTLIKGADLERLIWYRDKRDGSLIPSEELKVMDPLILMALETGKATLKDGEVVFRG